MVTKKEWLEADDYAVFENKNNHRRIIKTLLKENLRNVEKTMIEQYAVKGQGPTTENIHRIQDLIESTLENFEIVETKHIAKAIPTLAIEDKAHMHIQESDGKGEYCYNCGYKKQDTQIVQKEDKVIRICRECLGV